MIVTAVDTNILVGLWSGTADAAATLADQLSLASSHGTLVIAAPVYAELIAAPDRDEAFVETFLHQSQIRVDWLLAEEIWRTAAAAYRGYVRRRRAQAGDPGPRRILADFLVGAHAVHLASALLTLDSAIYRASFPTLTLLPISGASGKSAALRCSAFSAYPAGNPGIYAGEWVMSAAASGGL